jgi:hypothetical protein
MAGLLRGGRLGQLGELLQRQVSGLAVPRWRIKPAEKIAWENPWENVVKIKGKSMGKCGEDVSWSFKKANKSGRIADVPARTPEQKS